jgi:septal ring factor EnvC (AmiA/AmiB activator)
MPGMKEEAAGANIEKRCRWCGRGFAVRVGPGRPREFCKQSCRQMDYESRRRSAELGLTETELVVTRSELEELRDALYVLETAIEDVDRDLASAGDDPAELRRAIDWLLAAARPLLNARP